VKFKSTSDKAIRFEVANVPKDVAPGAECHIPDAFAWVVKSRGLPLVAVPGTEDAPQSATADLVPALNKMRELLKDANDTIEEQGALIQSLRDEARDLREQVATLGRAGEQASFDLAAASNRVRELERDVERLTAPPAPVQTMLEPAKADKPKADAPKSDSKGK